MQEVNTIDVLSTNDQQEIEVVLSMFSPEFILLTAAGVLFWAVVLYRMKKTMFVVHSSFVVLLSIFSLNELGGISEVLVCTFSMTYFMVHAVKMVQEGQYPYLLHHAVALILIVGVLNWSDAMRLKFGSRVLMTELSTPLLYIWEQTRRRVDFMVFMTCFFFIRPIHLGKTISLAFDSLENGPLHMVLVLLWVMNVAWFAKQCGLIFNYSKYSERIEEKKKQASSQTSTSNENTL